MGMAAGQARLLSITSRMSDNELRAQLINNDKMRLATKSAQVSEAYTNALNNAQLMFTNYDKENNTSYKELTFNSLTAYNQYNNQYAISNSAGQLLVSETDAKNFEKSTDLASFLKCYGLEETTTYFDNLSKYSGVSYYTTNDLGEAVSIDKSNGVVYNTGSLAEDKDGVSHNIQVDSGYSPETLKNMYEGKDGYDSYNTIKSSEYYYNYQSALSNFSTAEEAYTTKAAEIMNKLYDTVKVDGKNLSTINSEMNASTDIEAVKKYLEMIKAAIDGTGSYGNKVKNQLTGFSKNDESVNSYFEAMKTLVTDGLNNERTINSGLKCTPDGNQITYNDGDQDVFVLNKSGASWTAQLYKTSKDENGNEKWALEETKYQVTKNSDGTLSFTNGLTGEDEITYTGIPEPEKKDLLSLDYTMPDSYTFKETTQLDIDDLKYIGQHVIDSLSNTLKYTFDIKREEYQKAWTINNNGDIEFKEDANHNKIDIPEYTAYKEAAEKLYETIFGNAMPSNFDENKWSSLTDINAINQLGQNFNTNTTKATEFEKIKQAKVLDAIMNTYGEPNYDWIDTSNKKASYNENGSAKAQWYTNLYNKMTTSGYKALQDGLASSAEWIQFAFESGLVCLEQVDANNNWNTTTYTNCSDITEQTNNAALTKAEAEYNAAMAKIENKDKRYDLELKNIDTEHNSLQTEYDSIKTAIDKNIERTFKIYS